MRKHRIYISIAIIAVFVAVLTPAWAGPGRNPVSGEGNVTALDGIGTGMATLTIRGVTLTADLSVEILDTFISDEGVMHVVAASHKFDFGGGDTFTTSDVGIAEPTDTPGILTLNEKLRIEFGTGRFENASGDLSVHGVITIVDFETYEMHISFRIRGSISR